MSDNNKRPIKQERSRYILSQTVGDKKLKEITPLFSYSHPNLVSYVTSQFRKQLVNDKGMRKQIDELSQLIVDHVTRPLSLNDPYHSRPLSLLPV